MINAKDARAMAEQARQDRLGDVERCIKDATQKGLMKCAYCYFLDPDTLEKLFAAGYKVMNCSNPSDGPVYEIQW